MFANLSACIKTTVDSQGKDSSKNSETKDTENSDNEIYIEDDDSDEIDNKDDDSDESDTKDTSKNTESESSSTADTNEGKESNTEKPSQAESSDNSNDSENNNGSNETENSGSNETGNGSSNETENGSSNETENGGSNETGNGGSNETENGGSNETENGSSNETENGSSNETENGSSNETENGGSNETENNGSGDSENNNGSNETEDNNNSGDSNIIGPPTPQKTTVSAEIVNKNGAKGVITLISDDGDQRTADFFYTKVAPKYSSFKITIALPTSKVATLGMSSDGKSYSMNASGGYSMTEFLTNKYTAMSGSVLTKSSLPKMTDFWKKVTDTGVIEIASHSHSHGPWPAHDNLEMSGSTVLWPKGSAIKEIRASAQIIRNALKQETPFIMRPGGSFMTDEVSTYFKSLFNTDTTYLGMRSSNGAPPFKGATSAGKAKLNTVSKFTTKDGRLTIATLLVRGYEAAFNSAGDGFATTDSSSKSAVQNAGISAWKQYVDYAMQFGQWGSIAFHSVVSDSSTATGYAVYDKQVMALMDYIQPLTESGDLWLASFADAAKYYFEWSSASVSATQYDDTHIEVSLTDKETDERFDEPLTVKLTIPSSWTSAKLTTGGKTTTLKIHTASDGSHFVYANIVPSDSISTVKP